MYREKMSKHCGDRDFRVVKQLWSMRGASLEAKYSLDHDTTSVVSTCLSSAMSCPPSMSTTLVAVPGAYNSLIASSEYVTALLMEILTKTINIFEIAFKTALLMGSLIKNNLFTNKK